MSHPKPEIIEPDFVEEVVSPTETESKATKKPKEEPDWAYLKGLYDDGGTVRYLASLPQAKGVSHMKIQRYADKHEWNKARKLAKKIQDAARYKNTLKGYEGPDAGLEYVSREVDRQALILDRQQTRIDDLAIAFTKLNGLLNAAIEDDDGETPLDMRLTGLKNRSLVEVLESMVKINTALQNSERRAFSLDTQVEEIEPIVPDIATRSIEHHGGDSDE